MEDSGEYFNVVQEINARDLGVSKTPNEVVNLDMVREFYENAKPTKERPLEKVSWVQSQRDIFDRDIIHSYIEDKYVAYLRRFDPFVVYLEKGNWD